MGSDQNCAQKNNVVRYGMITAVFWTLLIIFSLLWASHQQHNGTLLLGRMQGEAYFEKDILYRRWASRHGGVYVPVSESTKPNPNLSHVPERDLLTPSGRQLTLMNPAYMTRQVFEMAQEYKGTGRGHITSLKPLRDANAPDAWEKEALFAFERGATEQSQIQQLDGKRYYRYMKPLIADKPCLKCHYSQGYSEGDVRGGLSVSVNMEPLYALEAKAMRGQYISHALIWLLGIAGIGYGTRTLHSKTTTLYKKTEELELEIEARQAAQESLEEQSSALEEEISERKQTEERLQKSREELRERNDELQVTEEMLLERIEEYEIVQTQLREAKVAADSANSAKSQFLANMSHEIRTPMNGILGMTQLMEMTELTEEQREYVANLKLTGKNLMSLLNDILDLSKIEAGKLDIVMAEFNLNHCINDIILMQKTVISGKGLTLNVSAAGNMPHVLTGDQLRIKQILLNLLGNAVKFTEQGSITLSTHLLEQRDKSVLVKISVRDTGIGISPNALDVIFKPFTQEDGSKNRKYGGTGLGLTISQNLAQLMGGSITVESTPGVGSCFTLTLPLMTAGSDGYASKPPMAG